jgi:hypothetical protein
MQLFNTHNISKIKKMFKQQCFFLKFRGNLLSVFGIKNCKEQ